MKKNKTEKCTCVRVFILLIYHMHCVYDICNILPVPLCGFWLINELELELGTNKLSPTGPITV